jgi:hypothetical protein
MLSQPLIIRTCHHILPGGHHCQGAAVRGRACCRHHLDARTRLHNMARAHRRTLILRLRVADTRRDLACNRAEVSRVVATGRIDFDTARMLFWAMDLSAAALPAESASRPRPTQNPNVFYHVPINPLFAESCVKNPSQISENKRGQGGGVSSIQAAGIADRTCENRLTTSVQLAGCTSSAPAAIRRGGGRPLRSR